jgi:hypothetical protein
VIEVLTRTCGLCGELFPAVVPQPLCHGCESWVAWLEEDIREEVAERNALDLGYRLGVVPYAAKGLATVEESADVRLERRRAHDRERKRQLYAERHEARRAAA